MEPAIRLGCTTTKRTVRLWLLVTLALVSGMLAAPAVAVMYTITRIAPPAGALSSVPALGGIGPQGAIVGLTDTSLNHGFIWADGTTVDLGQLPGTTYSTALGVNGHGQVVGSSTELTETAGYDHAVLWQGGTILDLGTLPGDATAVATAINDAGVIVGTSYGPFTVPFHCFRWSAGTMTDLGLLPGGDVCEAAAINERGEVVGRARTAGNQTHAFLHDGVGMVDLGVFPGGTHSAAYAINDLGHVVGQAENDNYTGVAFVYRDGVMTSLEPLFPGRGSWASGINNHDQLVVNSDRPYLVDDAGAHDLTAAIVNPTGGAYWTLFSARGINDSGQIVVEANFHEPPDFAPKTSAALLDPIICGDGTLEPGEDCDHGAENGADRRCTIDCRNADADGDGVVDADDPCTNVGRVTVTRARLTVGRLRSPAGDESLRLFGTLEVPAAPPIDLAAHGVHVLLADSAGGALLDLVAPQGAAWKETPRGWHFVSRGPSPGALTRILVARVGRSPGAFRVAVELRRARVDTPADGVVRLLVDLAPPGDIRGQCGETTFHADDCVLTRPGTTLRCRP